MLTQHELAKIQDAAERARRAGNHRISCPSYPDTQSGRERRDHWLQCYADEDARLTRKAPTSEAETA